MKKVTYIKNIVLTAVTFCASGVFAHECDTRLVGSVGGSLRPAVAPGDIPGNQPRVQWTEKESLFFVDLRDEYLPNSEFTPTVSWAGEQWSNISGGMKTGTTWDSLFTIGFEQKISSLAGADNLGVIGFSSFYYTASNDFSGDYVGALSDPSNIFSGDMLRVFEIFYKLEFETAYGNIGFRVGQLAADEDFMGLDYANIFLNSSFGAIPANASGTLTNSGQAFSQYALATLGATVFWSNDNFDAIIGLYNGDSGEDVAGNHGFDYSLNSLAIWYQLGYNYEIAGLSGRAMFGGNYHNGNFVDFNTGLGASNFYSFYLGLQQDFIADDDGHAILGGFCRLAWAPNETISEITKYLDAGLAWYGPIPSRCDDVFAFGVSVMETGSAFRNAEDLNQYETMLETTYRFQLTKAITLQPCFQVYLNSKNEFGDTKVAYVAGARLEINF